MTVTHVSPQVAAFLGAEVLKRLRARPRHPTARCFRCDLRLGSGPAELVVEMNPGDVVRVVYAHRTCQPSALVAAPSPTPPAASGMASIMFVGRHTSPRVVLVVDDDTEVLGRHDNGDLVDLRLSFVLETGFSLWTGGELDELRVAIASQWTADWDGDTLRVAHAKGFMLWDGPCLVPPQWAGHAAVDGVVMVVVGSRIGIADGGLSAVLAAQRRGALAVAAMPSRRR